ncbi:PIG-L family deacetylase [Nanoarchaeota archaeon]
MKKKVCIIVAHPDDETIWMGGTLLKNKNSWKTTIISLCRSKDKDRAPKFKKVCKIYKAKCFISNLEDEKLNKIQLNEVNKRISRYSENYYDCIFTHGKNGEYGHIRHIDVHKSVKNLLAKKTLQAKKVFYFSYNKKGKYSYPNKNSEKFIKLDDKLHKTKTKIIQELYGFDKKSFENLCCRDKEAFKVEEIL